MTRNEHGPDEQEYVIDNAKKRIWHAEDTRVRRAHDGDAARILPRAEDFRHPARFPDAPVIRQGEIEGVRKPAQRKQQNEQPKHHVTTPQPLASLPSIETGPPVRAPGA